MVTMFLKSDLKGDMLLEFSNGVYAFVWHNVDGIGDYLMAPYNLPQEKTTRACLYSLNDNLELDFYDSALGKLVKIPVVSIYSGSIPGRLGLVDNGFRKKIWSRTTGFIKLTRFLRIK